MSDKQVPRMPIQASSVKKGTGVILKGRPCKVLEVKTSKTGKHGHAKANITGSCVLSGQKCNEVHPAHASLTEFKLSKLEYLVTGVEPFDDAFKISTLDEDNQEVIFYSKPANEFCKGTELVAAIKKDQEKQAAAAAPEPDKQYVITVIRAPVAKEGGEEEFVDEELIEAFREDRS